MAVASLAWRSVGSDWRVSSRWLGVGAALCVVAGCHRDGERARTHGAPVGLVTSFAESTRGTRVDGRAGDLVLQGSQGTSLTFASTPDAPGHRPLRGAVIDARAGAPGEAHADPLAWWRAAWFDGAGVAHPLVATEVAAVPCRDGNAGVRSRGTVDGVALERTVCAAPGGRFEVLTRAVSPLPGGAALGDEVHAGDSHIGVDRRGEAWTGEVTTRFVTVAERDVALAYEGEGFAARRNEGADHDDLTRSLLWLRYAPGASATRTLHVVAGDALAAVAALPFATRRVALRGAAREFDLRDAAGAVLFHGALPPDGARALRLPPDLGTAVLFRDEHGVPALAPEPLGETVTAPPIERTMVRLRYTDERGQPLPVHVLFRGLAGTPDPTPRLDGRGYHAGRSVYLLDGTALVALAPGHYRITASHGPRYSLAVQEVALAPRTDLEVSGALREVVPTPGWISGDFHLHAAPSPDSHVSLPERVAALYCEGVDFAVATDHNHVTDYGPARTELGVAESLDSLPGEEVTTFAPQWGHFIAYPMPVGGARSAGIVPYSDSTPSRIFADARARGAQVIQVNHGRMHPNMGYFDFTHLDAATGRADATFAGGFDAVEAFNGWYIEHPEAVRTGVQDLVGLVRRGMRPTATGNSDSHELLYEEAGYPRTYVNVAPGPAATQGDRVIDAILHGRTSVSAGPFVELTVGGDGPGATVHPDARGRLRVHVRVRAPAWVPVERVEVWVDDAVARSFDLPDAPADGVRFESDVDLSVPRDAVVLAWADARTPLPDVLPYPHAIGVGFTGLLYVDADGDGRVQLGPRATAP